MREGRIIIIGLDGVPYRMIKDLSERGVMNSIKSIIDKGIFRSMESSIPEVSSVAWSSIITGVNPAEHGIFGFTDFPINTYRLSFPNFKDLKVLPFWMGKDNGRHIIINVPFTYPARELNGILISGFVALDIERATYPSSLVPHLKRMNYKIDVESEKAHQSIDLFIKDLFQTLEARIAVYRYLWGYEWQTFMLVFTGTDRLAHFLWDAYEDGNRKYYSMFLEYFRKIDETIGEILSKTNKNDTVMIFSDHGFELLEKDIYVNFILKEGGFLNLGDNPRLGIGNIDKGTKAFALDPARIYINFKGKYPRGGVEEDDKKFVIKEIEDIFNSLEFSGKKVIRRIYKKEEIYKGPFFNRAPDLILIGEQGFNLRASLMGKEVFNKSIFTGKHTQHDAFLIVNKNEEGCKVPENPTVFDVVNIIERNKSNA